MPVDGADPKQKETPVIDLDALRGWSEDRDERLRQPHGLPALGRLVQIRKGKEVEEYGLFGEDVVIGRFRSQIVPVDLLAYAMVDHELYRLGAPHVHLSVRDDAWKVKCLSPPGQTRINGEPVDKQRGWTVLQSGDRLTLGATEFLFDGRLNARETWAKARVELLGQVDEPALFLKRQGGVCGPYRRLPQERPLEVGRTYPAPGTLPGTEGWPEPAAIRWDLSGLYGHERNTLAFRHAQIELVQGRWTIKPLSNRQRTFVNRIAISGMMPLEGGDEVALGTVLFRFHHPHRTLEERRPRHIPAMVDWSEGRPPGSEK